MHWNPTLSANPYETDLDRNPANYQPLTPLAHLERAALIHPDHLAIIHGSMRVTYRHFLERSRQLANALTGLGISKGDTVSVMLSNTPAMLEAHHGVPMIGAVLHSINTRLDAQAIAFQLDHADCRVLIVDREFSAVMAEALALATVKPVVIDYDDTEYPDDAPFPKGARIGSHDYDEFVVAASPEFTRTLPADEWDADLAELHLRHHRQPEGRGLPPPRRGLMGYSNVIASGMGSIPSICGRCRCSTATAGASRGRWRSSAGTHVCLRWVRAKAMYDAIADHKVTHLCGAPIVMSTLLNAPDEEKREFRPDRQLQHRRRAAAGSVLAGMADAGFEVVHLYGLTETYGPAVVNEWNANGPTLPSCRALGQEGAPGRALSGAGRSHGDGPGNHGESAGRWRNHRRGDVSRQYRHEGLPEESRGQRRGFRGGWFHSGDLGVMHPTAISSSRTARRTSSSPAARTSRRSRSKMHSTSIQGSWLQRLLPGPMTNGAKPLAPLSNSGPAMI
jgi:fatty-acyl-CoA synthase